MTKIVSMILGVGPNGLIGRKDKLVWKSKEDLNYFKSKTYMQPCIFGATTFYGLPKYPLVNRLNIVLDNSQKEEINALQKEADGYNEQLKEVEEKHERLSQQLQEQSARASIQE